VRYVVREGTVRGQGRYLTPSVDPGLEWSPSRDDAYVSALRINAAYNATETGVPCRVVKLVPKRQKPRVTRAQVTAFVRSWNGYTSAGLVDFASRCLRAAGIEVDDE
jgi:hypothetical protein